MDAAFSDAALAEAALREAVFGEMAFGVWILSTFETIAGKAVSGTISTLR